jgi:hypothetical protein
MFSNTNEWSQLQYDRQLDIAIGNAGICTPSCESCFIIRDNVRMKSDGSKTILIYVLDDEDWHHNQGLSHQTTTTTTTTTTYNLNT